MSVKSAPESKVLKNDLILGCPFEAGLKGDWAMSADSLQQRFENKTICSTNASNDRLSGCTELVCVCADA